MSNNVIVQSVCNNYDDLINITSPRAKEYASKIGFEYKLDINEFNHGRAPAWNKIFSIDRLLRENYEWIFFLDGDALITNYDYNILDYVKPNKTIFFCNDGVGDELYNVNTGAFLLKNTPFVRNFITNIKENESFEHWYNTRNWEQNAIHEEIDTYYEKYCSEMFIYDSNEFNHNGKWVYHPAWEPDKNKKIECIKKALELL